MTLEYILNQAGIQLLFFVVFMFYGIRFLVVKDSSCIKGKNMGPLKNEKEFAKTGGKLILFFGVGTLLMAVLIFVNIYAAVAEIIICTMIMGVLWKRMNDKYGG